jgi:signal transduction histidine kinase
MTQQGKPADTPDTAHSGLMLLGMISHELRTPLQTMLANVELLRLYAIPAEATSALDRLESSAELVLSRLDNVTGLILSSNSRLPEPQRFNLPRLLQAVADELAADAALHGQEVEIRLDASCERDISGDPVRLHQVLNNYVSNAVRYAGPGRISLVGAAVVDPALGSDVIELSVVDHGPGLSHGDVQDFWQPFVRGKQHSGSVAGMGLGLAVVRMLATAAGWVVDVRPSSPAGSTFFVRFPAQP